MKGKVIVGVYDFNQEYEMIILNDGTGQLVKTVAILSKDEMEDLSSVLKSTTTVSSDKPSKEEPKKPSKEEPKKSEKSKTPLTEEAISEMGYDELAELVEEHNIDIEVSAYKRKEVDELREDILAELGLGEEEEEEEESEEPEEDDDDPEEDDDDPEEGDDDPEEGEEEEDDPEEEEEEDEDLSWEDLEKMDYEELSELCSEEKLDVEPEDYEEDEEAELRKAIAEELEIEIPKKGKKRK